MLADELLLCIDANPDGEDKPVVPSIGRVELRVADAPMLSILDEALGLFGNRHRALGGVLMTGFLDPDSDNDGLVISNIGSSGEDGVSIDVGGAVLGHRRPSD